MNFDPVDDFWQSYEYALAVKRARGDHQTAPSYSQPPDTPAAAPAPVASPNVATGALSHASNKSASQ